MFAESQAPIVATGNRMKTIKISIANLSATRKSGSAISKIEDKWIFDRCGLAWSEAFKILYKNVIEVGEKISFCLSCCIGTITRLVFSKEDLGCSLCLTGEAG
ncbi:MAG: hypothetical protein D6728_16080 [Cyanobacteria bacterium J055]|nr:MAG: hypothetical protein D6728_16080 [Cyanobacteria bacterium J055]